MKKIMVRLCIALCLIFGMLSGCSAADFGRFAREDEMAEQAIFAMDTYMSLKAYGKQAERALALSCARIEELEGFLSVTKEESDIWRINHANGEEIEIRKETAEILNTAIQIGKETQGALDITLYPVLMEWGFTTEEYQIPEQERLQKLLTYVDYRQIALNGNLVCVPEEVKVDCGALAKGYASDQVIEIFQEAGVKSALINLGGNVYTLGRKPDGSLWKIGIRNPFEEAGEMCILSTADRAVVTSGNYERYFVGEDGNRYWHILDAADGYPADSGLVSVTIIGKNGLFCDALSTAFFVAGMEKAVAYWRERQDFEMILVTNEKTIYITEGIQSDIRNVSEMKMEIINKL